LSTVSTLYLAVANPVAGREAEFNEWYDNVHIPDLLAVPGVRSAQRFELADAEVNTITPSQHRYLVVYELDGEPTEIMGEIARRVQSGAVVLSDAMDMTTTAMSFWSPLGPRRTAA
jgi:hypothetical protein